MWTTKEPRQIQGERELSWRIRVYTVFLNAETIVSPLRDNPCNKGKSFECRRTQHRIGRYADIGIVYKETNCSLPMSSSFTIRWTSNSQYHLDSDGCLVRKTPVDRAFQKVTPFYFDPRSSFPHTASLFSWLSKGTSNV